MNSANRVILALFRELAIAEYVAPGRAGDDAPIVAPMSRMNRGSGA